MARPCSACERAAGEIGAEDEERNKEESSMELLSYEAVHAQSERQIVLNRTAPSWINRRCDRPRTGTQRGRQAGDTLHSPFGPAPPEGTLASATLRASWARLVGVLALGPAPELRACPACHSDCRRAATLYGNCWTRLPPAPSAGDAAPLAARPGT